MQIQYYGDFCFKIVTKPEGRATDGIVIVTDPLAKGAGLRSPQGEPDVVFLSHNAEDYDVKGEKTAVLDMPGEFAARGITAAGFNSFTQADMAKAAFNTIFIFDSEGMQLGYLGALGQEPLPDVLDKLSGSDILFVPVDSAAGWDVKTAVATVKKIEPKIIIPMHFDQKGLTIKGLSSEKAFIEALGGKAERLPKLTLKKKDIEGDSMKVVVLERGA